VNEFDAAQFEALGPWITGFEFGGVQYGGQYRAGTDPRVLGFVSTFRERLAASNRRRDQPLRILECGCLEGGHTTVLAQACPEAEITSTDVREASLQKAKFILLASGVTNVRLSKENLNEPSAALSQQYDAIFCIGLLYHLRHPQSFSRAPRRRPTFYGFPPPFATNRKRLGSSATFAVALDEAVDQPLAGVNPQSFFPTIRSLAKMFRRAGFSKISLLEKSMTPDGNGPAELLKAEKT